MRVIISSAGRAHRVDFKTVSDVVKHTKLLFLLEIELQGVTHSLHRLDYLGIFVLD